MWPWAAQHNLVGRGFEIHAAAEMGKVKLKEMFTLEQATMAQTGSRGIALLFP
jgi:hypothetical protein